jgi:outer membrane receptor protein involved in Fe transport
VTGAALGLLALGSPCAVGQEEETPPAESAGSAEPEAPAEPQPQAQGQPGEQASASVDEEPRALEEIVVTARKVTESLHDAPLSVVVLDAEKMTTASITKVEELVPYVPNIAMSETGIGTNLYVRGIGSGINQGFEQSVGLYIDGIYYGRAQLTRAPFLDIAQAEALRGPQATLLGNNSIAGALNLTTARPTDTFYASVDGLYEPDDNEQEFTGVISGPITDRLAGRFAGRYKTIDGYMRNVTLDRDEPNREEKSARLTVAWDGDIWDATLKGETNSFDVKGRQIEIIKGLPSIEAYRDPVLAEQAGVGLTSQTGFSRNTGSAGLWTAGQTYLEYLDEFFDDTPGIQGNPLLGNDVLDYERGACSWLRIAGECHGDSSNNDIDVGVLTMDWDFGGYTLTSTTGYLTYEYDEICDCDFTGAQQFILESKEEYDQWSQELRLTSPTEDRVHWLAGVYYQNDGLDFGDQIFLPIGSGVVRLVGYATTGNDQGANDSLGNTSAFRDFHQNNYVSSVFGQVGIDITDIWSVSAGLRYSHIEKEASRILREGDLDRVPFDLNTPEGYDRLASGAVLFASIFKVSFHQLSDHRTEDNTAWEIVTDLDITDDVMLYASAKKGFKSGGFDVRSNSEPVPGSTGVGSLFPASSLAAVVNNVPPGTFEFEDERAMAYEAGMKISSPGRTAEVNIALFSTKFENLQVSIYDGTLGFNVGNAARATTQGLELDGRWAVTDKWYLTGSFGLLDFNFDSFKNGQCNQGQQSSYFALNLPTSDPLFGKCDYTDMTNQYVADWSGSLGINYEQPLGSALLLRTGLDVLFTADYNPSQNLDPRIVQSAYAELNLRVGLADADGRWEVAVLGRNLTAEEIVSYANDTPLAFSQFGTPTWYGFIDRPRSVALQASYKFGD